MTTKFAFFGTPALAAEILDALEAAGYTPSIIVTMPDRPQGRGMEMKETAVAAWGTDRHIPVLKSEKLDAEFCSKLQATGYKMAIVVAYGKMFPRALLDLAPMYNVHYSLLPRWRGATPVESAILAGDSETGVAIQKIVYKLDAGAIVALEKTPIDPDETTPELRGRLNAIAATALVALMPALESGNPPATEQDESTATSCGKMSKEDGFLDLSDDGIINYRKYRAYALWPRTYAFFERDGKKIRGIITKAHMEGSKFVIDTIKPEGKGEMSYVDFIRSGAKPI